MRRTYKVPPNMRIKEKIIGGILNINQFAWLAGGLLLGGVAFISLFPLIGAIPSVIVAILIIPVGTPFAFYKKNELTLFQYITLKRKFNKKTHKLPNKRKEVVE